jgi:hypothetical protein
MQPAHRKQQTSLLDCDAMQVRSTKTPCVMSKTVRVQNQIVAFQQKGSNSQAGEYTDRRDSKCGYGTRMTKKHLNEAALCWRRDAAVPGRLLPRAGVSIEHLVNEPPGTNVLHVHFEAGAPHEWYLQLPALIRAEAALDAVVNESHEACCYNDTA